MDELREARFYNKVEGGAADCFLCNHHCKILEGGRGVCRVRENQGGVLYSRVYGRPCAIHVDPIEKKPLFHYHPGSKSYSVATEGCNFRCVFCQNHEISQVGGRDIGGFHQSPHDLIADAVNRKCDNIAYTYTEPTVFMEYALDCIDVAREKGLGNVFVSNGFMSGEAVDALIPVLDAINIDLKSFSDEFYKSQCGGRLQPVLDNIQKFWDNGVWVEVTTLLIPGLNDSQDEVSEIANFLSQVSRDIPWHISRFHPDYNMMDRSPTAIESLREAFDIGKKHGLRYVYMGNVPHMDSENTYCPSCNSLMVERDGFHVKKNGVSNGECLYCGHEIAGRF